MKMSSITILVIVFLSTLLLFSDQKEIREDMVVINVEIPVRVMYKGKPVDNLKKSDFKLFGDGKEQKINGFFIKKHKIGIQSYKLSGEKKMHLKPRFFVLAFSITKFNKSYSEGVNFFIEEMLRTGDKLLVFVNSKTMNFGKIVNKQIVQNKILEVLKIQGRITFKNMQETNQYIEKELTNLKIQLNSLPRNNAAASQMRGQLIIKFLKDYEFAWKNYKRKHLKLNLDSFYNFAKYLKEIDIEKFVLTFYQLEKFPVLNSISELSKTIRSESGIAGRNFLRFVDLDQKVERVFPADEVSRLFYRVNATFDLILIPTLITETSREIKAAEVSTAIENTMREIIKKTGGSVYYSMDLKKVLNKIVEKEDIFYILTYSPTNTNKKGKIKFKLVNPKFKLLYDNNIRKDFMKEYLENKDPKVSSVEINHLNLEKNHLKFGINNFVTSDNNGLNAGNIIVKIVVKDDEYKIIYERKKHLLPTQKKILLDIKFDWLREGKYHFILEIEDKMSGQSAYEYLISSINQEI